jgi:hypothetical protein
VRSTNSVRSTRKFYRRFLCKGGEGGYFKTDDRKRESLKVIMIMGLD